MRIPVLIAIPVSLLTMLLVWWLGTRNMDFLIPPSEAKLEQIREEALASLPVSKAQEDAISIKVPLPEADPIATTTVEAIDPAELGDLTSPTVLDTYSDRAPDGAEKLLALAKGLEEAGAFQRALLANERVLDLSQSNPDQILSAINSIRRIRPTLTLWNTAEENKLPVTLHIGTGEKFAEQLPVLLQKIADELNIASSGLIRFSYKLNIGRSVQTEDAPTPVALWITGQEKDSPSTDVLSFTTDNPDTLRNDLLKTIFNLIRGHLSKSSAYSPAPEAVDDPMPALESHITRLLWKEFATLLNPKVPE